MTSSRSRTVTAATTSLPRGFAIRWTRGAEKQIDGIKRSRDAREIRGLDHAEEVRAQLEGLDHQPCLLGPASAGKLFGAVTPADVALAIKKAGGPADRQAVHRDRQADQDRR